MRNGRQHYVVRWLLENGVDREKPCYHGQTPLEVVGQCRLDVEAASDIRQALTEELKGKLGSVDYPAGTIFATNHYWHYH